jgi:hypothetical protein
VVVVAVVDNIPGDDLLADVYHRYLVDHDYLVGDGDHPIGHRDAVGLLLFAFLFNSKRLRCDRSAWPLNRFKKSFR